MLHCQTSPGLHREEGWWQTATGSTRSAWELGLRAAACSGQALCPGEALSWEHLLLAGQGGRKRGNLSIVALKSLC